MASLSLAERAAAYQTRFTWPGAPGKVALPPHPNLRLVIVVPAFDEDLSNLLASLAACDLDQAEALELLLVINHPAGHPRAAGHAAQVQQYRALKLRNGLRVYSLDACSLPPREAGVGLARKLGMDQALARLAAVAHDGLIVGLDADCQVSPNYLQVLLTEETRSWRALALRFAHPLLGLPPHERQRIIDYEIWLRYYVLALRWAQYPWAWHTVGSSMAVRASAYAEVGGMNRRRAGEDFYFLHKLMPGGAFGESRALCVYPAARRSSRVPFGTGRAMLEMAQGQKDFGRLYAPAIFRELQGLHAAVRQGEALEDLGYWRDFLAAEPKWGRRFAALAQRSPSPAVWRQNFWSSWDGFAVLRFVHFRRAQHPDVSAAEAVADLWGFSSRGEALLAELGQREAAPFFRPGDAP